MKNRLTHLVGAAAVLCTLAHHSIAFGRPSPPIIPDELQPPAGNELYLAAEAAGTQNYICMPTATAMTWTFLGPQATLFVTFGRDFQQQIATHFLSPNPAENGTARATWQSSLDSSALRARAIKTVTDPNVVEPGAIPWLLLQVVGTQPGANGSTGLAQTTYVQRINTTGGIAPSTGCTVITDMGRVAYVPYTTEYRFYRAVKDNR